MIPPVAESTGFPTVSPSQLRVYGAAGFTLETQENDRGCPRRYKAQYVEDRIPVERDSYPLLYGRYFHAMLEALEKGTHTPDDVVAALLPGDLTPEAYAEAQTDLDAYLERGSSPIDRYATLSSEVELAAELFVDPEFGPIWYRGKIDWIGVDPDEPETIHVVDYKTNRTPPSIEQVRGDVQMKGYAWLAAIWALQLGMEQVRVVVHLDAIKWREVEIVFTREEIEGWHAWACAVVRQILRDDEGAPVTNPGCPNCPVRFDCSEFAKLPENAAQLAGVDVAVMTPEQRLRWRDQANTVRLMLAKAVEGIDESFKASARELGRFSVGDVEFVLDTEWKDVVDLPALHAVMGDKFYDVVRTSKTAIVKATKTSPPGEVAAVMACVTRDAVGSTVKRSKVKADQ